MAAKKSRKRAKTASGTKVEVKAEEKPAPEPPAPREPNRLQKAISAKRKGADTKTKVTIAQAKRIKKAEKQLGILSALPNAPVEIFCEIASYFAPEDLLSLSQASRELREFLLSKNSRRLWTACLSKTDLPPCPDDLNEPQYVFLLYDTSCNGCNAPRVRTVYYELRIRLCKSCFEVNVFSTHQLHYSYSTDLSGILDLIPHFRRYGSSRKYYYEQDLIAIEKELSAIKDDNERQVYRLKRLEIVAKIHHNAYHFRELKEIEATRRKDELHDLGEEFIKSAKEKLNEIGYTEKDWSRWSQYDGRSRKEQWDKLILQKKVLTPRIWKTLLPKLQDLLDSNRASFETADRNCRISQRNSEFRSIYRKYTHDLHLTSGEIELMPCASDLMKVQAIVDSVNYDDSRRVFTDQLFASLLHKIVEAHPGYKQRVLADHSKALYQCRARDNERADSVNIPQHVFLASSLFLSNSYSDGYDGYPDYVYYFLNPKMPVVAGTSNSAFHTRTSCGCGSWDKSRVHIKKAYITLADALLANLGLSSATTMSAIIAMGKCFVCGLCDESFQEPLGWIELITHYISKSKWETNAQLYTKCHWNEKVKNIKVVKIHPTGEEDALAVSARKLGDKDLMLAIERLVDAKLKCKQCALCKALGVAFRMTDEQLTAHVRTIHGKVVELSDIIDLSANA